MTHLESHLKTALKVLCSIGLVLFLLFKIDFSKLSSVSWTISGAFVISAAITLLALLIMSFRWKILVRQYLRFEVPLHQLYRYYLTGSFFNIFLPGAIGGDVVRTKRLVERHGATIKGAAVITIVERLAGIYGLALLLSLSLALGNFPERFAIQAYVADWVLYGLPVVVVAFLPLLKWGLDKKNLPTSYGFIVETVAVLLLSQMGDITIAWVFSAYFGLDLPLSAFLFIMPIVYVATVIPISLGGLGVREGTFSGLMILYGVDASVAIVISFCMYLVKVLVGIIGYFVYLRDK